ncbi:unnamed protein product [Dibothriocephalus latus]|uniref:Ion transport domain-containing protein n=1 Tax=Dibothriocephalus latus TaxID=60516 RepID=A0A3P6VAD0_DIBLA|nr:unnamed protein product [Dibothriocephalus latus]
MFDIQSTLTYEIAVNTYPSEFFQPVPFLSLAFCSSGHFIAEIKHIYFDSDRFFNATNRIEDLIRRNESKRVKAMVMAWKTSPHRQASYFLEASRFHWRPDDPEIVSDVLFAVANVFSFARTTYLMPAFEALGPLQISFTRMLTDIVRFMVLYVLVSQFFMPTAGRKGGLGTQMKEFLGLKTFPITLA